MFKYSFGFDFDNGLKEEGRSIQKRRRGDEIHKGANLEAAVRKFCMSKELHQE